MLNPLAAVRARRVWIRWRVPRRLRWRPPSPRASGPARAALAVAGMLLWTSACQPDATPPRRGGLAALQVVADVVPVTVNNLVVQVTAPDISGPLIFNIIASGGTASGVITVPIGSARVITIHAYDAAGIETHRGSTTVDVHDGTNPTVTVSLLPLQGQQPIDVHIESLIITITPSSVAVRVDQTAPLQVSVTTSSGTPVTVGPTDIRWATLQPSIATVGTDGTVLGVAPGSTTIVAVYAGVAGSAAITVNAAPTLVAAGDVAKCTTNGDELTAALLDTLPGTVAMLGDGAYDNGTATEYANCYNPSWGRAKARTLPVPGNHDYQTTNATGYYGYFGTAAGDPTKGYYSYNLGAWHIIALNSEISTSFHSATSAQVAWLKADLAATTSKCVLAYWHQPRFSSGTEHGSNPSYAPFWAALYNANADVVLNGHEHNYERFAPQDTNGVADATRGIREFVVGTGGGPYEAPFSTTPLPTSEVRIQKDTINKIEAWGVLKLELRETSYRWWFIHYDGKVLDSGSTTCH